MIAVTATSQTSNTARRARGASRSSMKCNSTNRILTAAMSTIATVATVGATESLDSHQVDAQVANISAAQMRTTGLRSVSTSYRTRYSSGKSMIHSRSTMCQ